MGYDEAFAAVYDKYFGDYAENASPVLLRYFASRMPSGKEVALLDLGCGTGRLASRFLDAGYRVTGLDLSPHMLALAESRCARHLALGTARFLQADMTGFPPPGTFEVAVCTYNGMNHLENPEKMRGCFRSVRACLSPGGLFLFDYHTRKGLKEWAYSESTEWEEGLVEVTGWFKEEEGRAAMRLQGRYQGRTFDETLSNRTFPLGEVRVWLKEAGFTRVTLTEMSRLGEPLDDPDEHKRITVIAS